jgi:hypothetical protein
MLLFLQFTLIDLRPFSSNASNMLFKPSWPDPDLDFEFVRNAGAIIERKRQGLGSWVGEGRICNIGKGIRISKSKVGSNISINNFSKHCFTNRQRVMTKYEFVFNVKGISKEISYGHVHAVAEAILKAPFSIRINGSQKHNYVSELGKSLKQFHVEATSRRSALALESMIEEIIDCSPQFYFYLDKDETLDASCKSFPKFGSHHYDLYGCWKKLHGRTSRLWIHQRLTLPSLIDESRETRISIMRIHSEFESLQNIFKAIAQRRLVVVPNTPESDALQDYFHTSISTFLKQKKTIQLNIKEQFLDYFSDITASVFRKGELLSIVQQIKNYKFRRQIELKTVTYIEKQEIIMGSKYKFGDNTTAFSIGDGNKFDGATQNIGNPKLSKHQFLKLQEELKTIRESIAKDQPSPSLDSVLGEAQAAAEQKDEPKLVAFLRKGGPWLFDFATKVGASLTAALLKDQL